MWARSPRFGLRNLTADWTTRRSTTPMVLLYYVACRAVHKRAYRTTPRTTVRPVASVVSLDGTAGAHHRVPDASCAVGPRHPPFFLVARSPDHFLGAHTPANTRFYGVSFARSSRRCWMPPVDQAVAIAARAVTMVYGIDPSSVQRGRRVMATPPKRADMLKAPVKTDCRTGFTLVSVSHKATAASSSTPLGDRRRKTNHEPRDPFPIRTLPRQYGVSNTTLEVGPSDAQNKVRKVLGTPVEGVDAALFERV